MPFLVKSALGPRADADHFSFDEKTMYRGREIAPGDEVFVIDSETQGGRGLCARGVVTAARRGPGIRVVIEVDVTGRPSRPLGRADFKPFRELTDDRPETEIARRFYRQATNKIGRLSDAAGAFLASFF